MSIASSSVTSRTNFRRQYRSAAFTLLEVIIAVSLTSLLMLALWSMLSMYVNVSEKSERRVGSAQIARSLHQQLEIELSQIPFVVLDNASDDPAATESIEFDSQEIIGVGAETAAPFQTAELGPEDTRQDSDRSVEMIPTDAIYDITNDLWSQPGIRFRGNALSLVFDQPYRTEPRKDRRLIEPALGDLELTTPPSEVMARTVYVYVDRKEALVKGLPPGLLRVQFIPRELERIRREPLNDMFRIIEGALPDLFRKTNYNESWYEQPENVDPRTEALQRLNRLLGRSPVLEHNFKTRVDYVPEIRNWSLRFFDGFAWYREWNAETKEMLPVAVEVSFDVDMNATAEFQQDVDRLNESKETEITVESLALEEAAQEKEAQLRREELKNRLNGDSVLAARPNRFVIRIADSQAADRAGRDFDADNNPAYPSILNTRREPQR